MVWDDSAEEYVDDGVDDTTNPDIKTGGGDWVDPTIPETYGPTTQTFDDGSTLTTNPESSVLAFICLPKSSFC